MGLHGYDDKLEKIYYKIYGFFENLSGGQGFRTLDELYTRPGLIERPADRYLWNLHLALERGKKTFTIPEINELDRQVRIINTSLYPESLQNAILTLLQMLTKVHRTVRRKIRNASVRSIYEKRTGQSAAPGTGPASLIQEFIGVKPPKRAEGGKRSRKRSKTKKTRRN